MNELDKKAEIFKAMAHPIRLQIIKYLVDTFELNVKTLTDLTNKPQSSVSQQLNVLKAANIVTYRREVLEVYYCINEEYREYIKQLINEKLEKGR